jgi:hypothetical protein
MLTVLLLATAPLWVRLLLWLVRRIMGATPSTSEVSGNNRRKGTGPMWEQDKPFPECFEEDDL